MRITFLGAAREVTGSMHLIEVNGRRVLLECGLYQGRRADTYERNLNFPFDAASIDAVVLSHAHILERQRRFIVDAAAKAAVIAISRIAVAHGKAAQRNLSLIHI